MQQNQPTREKILDITFMLVYINGYNGTSISMILKECEIPKGSLYHHFKSKQDIVLTVIKERLFPKMDAFYNFNNSDGKHPIDILIDSIINVSNNELLIKYGCPLNRLNQEMSPLDRKFENAITPIYNHIKEKIILLLENVDFNSSISTENLSEYIIASVWGALSLSPAHSSKDRYLNTVDFLISYLNYIKK